MSDLKHSPASTLQTLLEVMHKLRQSCPWDQAQTPQSLTRYAIEEAYEVEAAVHSGDMMALRDELGDLLLQVVFQAEMAHELGDTGFDFNDVMQALTAKLIRRHPHVFGDEQAADAAAVTTRWEQIKQAERVGRGETTGLLDQIKPGPALMQAADLHKTAAKAGLKWSDVAAVRAKVNEELAELDDAIAQQDEAAIAAELGDSLFALVNLASQLKVNPEVALLGTLARFRQRVSHVEQQLQAQGQTWTDVGPEQLETYWQQAKAQEKDQTRHA